MLRKSFFSSMCCILLIQIFFIARKLLTNVNKQLNKAIGPSSLTATCSQWGKGKPSVRAGFSYIAESFIQNRKKFCMPQRFYITKAQIHVIHVSEQCPLILLLQRALSRTRQFLVKHLFYWIFAKHHQFTTPSHEFPSLQPSELTALSAPESHPCNEISGTRQH